MEIPLDLYRQIADNVPILCVDCIVEHEGKYLLVKRANAPLKGEYFVPGGRVLKNEKLEDAVHRKMKEEIGIDVEIIGRKGYYEDFYDENELGIDSVHTVGVVFHVKPLSLDIKLDNQSVDYHWAHYLPNQINEISN